MSAAPGSVDAILMASGFSRRFGSENKLLRPFRGKPLVSYTLALACGIAQFQNIFFVYADAAVGAVADAFPVTKIFNTAPQLGQIESIRLGVEASDADFYAFFTCDQPFLNKATVNALLTRRGAGKIVFPTSSGHPSMPSVFSASYRSELLSLQQGQHARDIKAKHPRQLVPVEMENADALIDLDTPELFSDREFSSQRLPTE